MDIGRGQNARIQDALLCSANPQLARSRPVCMRIIMIKSFQI